MLNDNPAGSAHQPPNPQQGVLSSVLSLMESAIDMNRELLDSMSLCACFLRGERVNQKIKSVNVQAMLSRMVEMVRLARPAKDLVEFKVNVAPQIENVITDELAVSRNLMNLLGNASRHTQRGSVVASASLITKGADKSIKFEVVDTGCGGCSTKPDLWKPFVSEARSTGLGLYLVQKQTEALGGATGVEENTQMGGGSNFWFTLPYHANNSDSGAYAPTIGFCRRAEADCINDAAQGTILLIDDMRLVLDSQAQVLRAAGFTVDTASSPEQGLAVLKQQRFSLVLCDYDMPRQTGPQMTADFRKWELSVSREPPQVIVALTGSSEEYVEKECLEAGMHALITKPMDIDCVRRLMQTYAAPITDPRVENFNPSP